MSLPVFQTADKDLSLMQTNWARQLNPLLNFPLCNGTLLKKVTLTAGTNSINHLLGRALQGWFIVRLRGAATVYDQQDTNPMPTFNLILVSSAPVVVDLVVF